MLHAVLTTLATAAEEGAESSHTPFYVAGALFAIYAVVLGAIGIVKHDFPSSKGVSRGVMGLGVLLMAATLATAITSS